MMRREAVAGARKTGSEMKMRGIEEARPKVRPPANTPITAVTRTTYRVMSRTRERSDFSARARAEMPARAREIGHQPMPAEGEKLMKFGRYRVSAQCEEADCKGIEEN